MKYAKFYKEIRQKFMKLHKSSFQHRPLSWKKCYFLKRSEKLIHHNCLAEGLLSLPLACLTISPLRCLILCPHSSQGLLSSWAEGLIPKLPWGFYQCVSIRFRDLGSSKKYKYCKWLQANINKTATRPRYQLVNWFQSNNYMIPCSDWVLNFQY